MNPIFIEYYSHENCYCYKILLPWTRYAEEKIVLCKVSDGLPMAQLTAVSVINEYLAKSFLQPMIGK